GLLAEGDRRRIVWPAGGQQQLWRILGELVDAQPTGARPLGDLLRLGMPSRSGEASSVATVIITPDLSAGWLGGLAEGVRGRRGGAMALLVADGSGSTPAQALAAAGVPAQIFDIHTPLPLASPPRRRVKSRISPLGRVIATAGDSR
ncbi:hypothetical protein K2Z83_01435, partial [Oscillochloris sp. ZM17-4]|nr:hypothetical protein [Oscillochloris sp. ZM17-4]